MQLMKDLYENIGYKCVVISAITGEGMDEIRMMLDSKVSLVSGNSGVGKSTFINALLPDLNLKTADISDVHDTGMHTTTFSEMYPFKRNPDSNEVPNSFIIDTPGIKGFGSFDMQREEISHYFREIFNYSHDCRFNNCTHTHEPGCAVLAALERHDISQSRYNSYLSMLEEGNEKYR